MSLNVQAQPICGFDPVHQEQLRKDPAYRKAIESTDASIRKYIDQHKNDVQLRTATALYTIPVVVHVVHTGGAIGTIYNPSDAQIQGAITYLNNVYNGTYPGLEGVGDMQIQFALATRDPNCNPTNGIDRIDGSPMANYVSNGVNAATTGGVADLTLKNFDRWDPVNYYNIWVVNKIDAKDGTSGQFIAGYAYFAGASASLDGAVMLATQMVTGQKTLPHEIGHALNLYHPFEGSPDNVTCPTNATCTSDGDMVCDTDPITYNQSGGVVNFTCRTGTNGCTGTAYSINTEHNFMNYTSCYTLFTAGQKARVLAAMSLPSRQSLVNSNAIGSYPGSFTAAGAASCTPATGATGLSASYAGIMNITINGKPFNTSTASIDGGYVNKSDKCLYLIQLSRGNTYNFSATVLTQNAEQFRMWIDYNNNGVFDNVTEQIVFNSFMAANAGAGTTISGTFTVPGTAVANTTLRLRAIDELAVGYPSSAAISSGCYAPFYGQAEDYPVYLSSLLPVEMTSFNGTRNNYDAVLNWRTSTELDVQEFQLERSEDGVSFNGVGTIAAKNSPAGAAYSYTDAAIGAGAYYYRLKIVDADGSFSYSKVVYVNALGKITGMRIRNNPFTDHIGIDFGTVQSGNAEIKLFDVQGQKVFELRKNVAGLSQAEISFPRKLSAGTYVIQIATSNGNLVQKLIKQ